MHEEVTEHMQAQLNEERFRYQNLLSEHLKLEERYADLRSEKEAAEVRIFFFLIQCYFSHF